uniref:Venom peptide HtfTx2 n=1 Tax=Hadogenes troglodytes TaxID=1577150 RepID=A0A1B3IJ28_9SCOR|nr:venom peptide HtfTx2 [Hadogenes troglodytes]
MNGKLCILVLAAMYFITVNAYMYIQLQEGKGHCLDASGRVREEKETWFDDDKCESMTCSSGGNYISIAGCGVVAGPPQCKRVRGTGSYPDCCPTIQC